VLYEVASADTERAARRIADLEVELEGLINRR
jgi:hypothetical protein